MRYRDERLLAAELIEKEGCITYAPYDYGNGYSLRGAIQCAVNTNAHLNSHQSDAVIAELEAELGEPIDEWACEGRLVSEVLALLDEGRPAPTAQTEAWGGDARNTLFG